MLDPDIREAMAKRSEQDRKNDAAREAVATDELKLATIALRDAARTAEAAKVRYQAALQAFNRCIAPDNG